MFQYMTSMLPSRSPKFSSEVSEIERFRARQRRLCRGQAAATSLSKMEKLDIDNGCTRKISANSQQQRTQCHNQQDDDIWPKSAGTEMHLGYNAFDFSASPEAFYDEPEEPVTTKDSAAPGRQQGSEELQEPELPVETQHSSLEQKQEQHMTSMAKQVTSMGTSTWDQMFPAFRHTGGPIQHMPPASGQMPLWGVPVHFTMYDQR